MLERQFVSIRSLNKITCIKAGGRKCLFLVERAHTIQDTSLPNSAVSWINGKKEARNRRNFRNVEFYWFTVMMNEWLVICWNLLPTQPVSIPQLSSILTLKEHKSLSPHTFFYLQINKWLQITIQKSADKKKAPVHMISLCLHYSLEQPKSHQMLFLLCRLVQSPWEHSFL